MLKQNRQAVVIGINEYKDPEIPKLLGAVNDATEMRKRLKDFGEFQIPEEHFLINAKAKGEAIRKAISDLLWKPDPCDLSLFYFSGHGFSDGYENGYIAPHDMLCSEPLVNGISMEELKKLVLRSVNKQCVLVILDCCFSGISTKGEKAISEPGVSLSHYFSDVEKAGEGKIIIASSGEDQKSRETEKEPIHGLFTSYLIEGLDGRARNEAGIITLDKLYKFVENQFEIPKQRPQFYAASTSQLEKIQIAVASDEYEIFITEKLKEADDKLSKEFAFSLIDAIKDVQIVLEYENDNLRAVELKNKIQKYLTEYCENSVMPWIANNEDELRKNFTTVYRKLQTLPECLEFEKISKLNRFEKEQLINLCEVSRGEIEKDFFFRKCRIWSNPSSSFKNQ